MSTVYSLQSTVYSLQSTVYSLQSTVYSLQSTVYSRQSTVDSLQSQSTVDSLQSTVYSLQSTVDSTVQRYFIGNASKLISCLASNDSKLKLGCDPTPYLYKRYYHTFSKNLEATRFLYRVLCRFLQLLSTFSIYD